MNQNYIFSAPGRTEISGNHADHQHCCVLAAAVNLSTIAEVTLNGLDQIRVQSEGYPMVEIDLHDLEPREEEKNTTQALVRGVAAAFVQRGAAVRGFDAAVRPTVLAGCRRQHPEPRAFPGRPLLLPDGGSARGA